MRTIFILCGLALFVQSLPAQTNTTERCLQHIDVLIEQLATLQQSATNETARIECIETKSNQIKGLRELTGSAAARLPELIANEETDALAAEQATIALACARAEKLAAEAVLCDAGPVIKTRRHHPPAEPVASPIQARGSDNQLRDEQTCLHQIELAGMLTHVMALSPDPKKPRQTASDHLAQFAIEPLRGWHPDECATLDDFCVAVARALNLKVANPSDPASYLQSLRDEALPVDAYLPERTEGLEPPLILESEARAFFAKGYAVPLPSSRPLE